MAEDPFNGFLPSVGRVVFAREPAGPGIRVESALYDGMEVTPYYDSLLAKVTAWGRNREGARSRMKRALAEFRIEGVATNIPYLAQILDIPDFVSGSIDTGFLDRHAVVAEEPLQRQKLAAEIGALLLMMAPEQSAEPAPASANGANHRGPASAWRDRMGNFSGVSRWR
ncbi:MAG: hypothetical protein AB7T37_09705 [Dehalococcoidia bacterium]